MPPPSRGIYANRTLNLRGIRAIGYDMDYTLVHYNVYEWERRAFEHLRRRLADRGWPVTELEFDADLFIRGLIIDRELGNIVKANRFGYVKLASHGTQMLGFDAQREVYSRTIVDLAEDRYVFLNTLFALSEAVMYARLVDMLDERQLPAAIGYSDLYDIVRSELDEAHLEGQLKSEIMADPERFVELDPEMPLALLDQLHAGKRLLLITNSDWRYTVFMMQYAVDPFLPTGMTWRDLFHLVIVSARKPDFFSRRTPVFRVVDEDGLLELQPSGITADGAYVACSAHDVEQYLGLEGASILYVGDHIFGDVHASKSIRRWRTALVARELELEMDALASFHEEQRLLGSLMEEKTAIELEHSQLRLALQRVEQGYATVGDEDPAAIQARVGQARAAMSLIDARIAPLARAANELLNPRWGLLMRTGNDKSHLARQMERHADVYTSRVSNFLYHTPFVYFRSPRGSLPHDPGWTPDPWASR
jgi:HAD superfamily 5'-nucleotidase-like hydrolase